MKKIERERGKKGRRKRGKKERRERKAMNIYLEGELSFLLGGRIATWFNRPQHTPHRMLHSDLCSEKFILWSSFQKL